MSVAEPFAEHLPGAPHTLVYPTLNPIIDVALTGLGDLADTMSDAGTEILQAVIDAQHHEPQQVAASALLSGTATVMAAYRQHIDAIGTHMGTAAIALTSAWTHYGASGDWSTPEDLRAPQLPELTIAITAAAPRPLAGGENIDTAYLEDVLVRVRHVGNTFATPSIEAFTTFVRSELLVGELTEAFDTIMVEHTAAMATTSTTMQQHLTHLADTIQTAHHRHRDTRLWTPITTTAAS
ncbi:hypothetical protein MABM_22140 [Mycobacteroides abscessus]|uniref:Uncharacterized protein n=1 Tax=Mycobacteroides abscessus subsp. bolletii 50594 TaxID=1303024 RepID=A0AB33A7G2_9MYCO|nr:hypothetical protein MASS_1092 [Mycobacteroides abscessus subsp. bolletii 50594]BBZ82298.1 hypothetical protein MABM_22140 [Mycobacteroides abscessus]